MALPCGTRVVADISSAKSRGYQDKTCGKGREGTIRVDGREDAQEARGATEEEREAQQDVKVLSAVCMIPPTILSF